MIDADKRTQEEILQRVRETRDTGEAVSAVLKTDQRVFARITDGIYREPASALRELIANAYDADATEVQVVTDAPRFSKIIVRDNGHGLTEEALVHVICHIGGSLKRTSEGKQYNVVSEHDKTKSPGGRKLIGKLGIGLFSVSQLTHHLTIVTKVEKENVRRVCDIMLMPQRDEQIDDNESDDEKKYVTGKVQIYTVPASDIESHGTEITLLEIRPFVRESLQSASLWASLDPEPAVDDDFEGSSAASGSAADEHDAADDEDDFISKPVKPRFHIGRVSQRNSEHLIETSNVPWDVEDPPEFRFRKLVDGVKHLDTGNSKQEKVKLSDALDTYFRTIWTLSLSIPVPYIEDHPFSLTSDAEVGMFALNNKPVRPSPTPIVLEKQQTLRALCNFVTPDAPSSTPFNVVFDGLLLRRPLSFRQQSNQNIPAPGRHLLFVGKIKSDMSALPADYSGGPLELEAYFYWQPRIVPVEHNGVMVRIHGTSGIMFDDQFFKYQVSEQNRLSQITAEIFVIRGLDSALNIDRESFNISHPHYQFMRKWVHHALRQMVSKQKSLTKGVRDQELEGGLGQAIESLNQIVFENFNPKTQHRIGFIESSDFLKTVDLTTTLQRSVVMAPRLSAKVRTKTEKLREALFEEKIKAVADVLNSYGVFDNLNNISKEELLRKVVAIFTVDIK
jgi:hypothetical protein